MVTESCSFLGVALLFCSIFPFPCESFHLSGTKRRRILRIGRFPSSVTTKKSPPLHAAGTDKMANDRTAATFDLDRWQSGGVASFSETPFAEYWEDLPSIVSENEKNAINPHDFGHRMALTKYLIENTGGESIWGGTGVTKCSKHPLWGYANQLDWQHRTRRFEDPSKWQDEVSLGGYSAETDDISKRSWWGSMNLCFSVASYCGAAEAGLVPSVSLSDESVRNDVGFQTCVEIWKNFWENDYSSFVAALRSSKDDEENATIELYRAIWASHSGIIQTGLKYSKDLEGILPKEDISFGLGWSNLVELLCATNYSLLSLDRLCECGAGYLPTMRVAGPKTLQWLKANREMEHTTVVNLTQLNDVPEKTLNGTGRLFARVSRWRFAWKQLPQTLHVLTHGNPIQKTLALSRAIVLALVPGSIVEIGVAASAMLIFALGKAAKTKKFLVV